MSNALRITMVLSMLSVAGLVHGAEFELRPSIAVSEEFTDNVFWTNTNRTSDYITHTLPGLGLSYEAAALTGGLNYIFDYRHYARKNIGDEITHSLSAKGLLTAVNNLMYLDISDEYQRVSLDATKDVTKESLFVNQSDRNVVTASPYITVHLSERIPLKTGYRIIETRYFSSAGTDKIDHVAFLGLAYELSKQFHLTADYTYTMETAAVGDYSQHQALGGFRYEYADKSYAYAQTGNTWTRYGSGQRPNSFTWNAGITHVFDSVTGKIITGVKYDEDPLGNIMKESYVNGTIEKRFDRGSLSFSPQYSEYGLTKTDSTQTKKYGATVGGLYEITADLKGRLSFSAEKYEQVLYGGNSRRLQADSGISYLLAKQITASLSYIYVEYYSPHVAVDNRHVNRGMIEIKKTF